MIAKFQYLTQDIETVTHAQLAEIACKNGIKWLQLRAKNKSFEDWLKTTKEVKAICVNYDCKLIINDNVSIAQEVDADGVHLGIDDMPPSKARQLLGANKIIGGTANSFEEVLKQVNNGCDYIGLGPFRHTETKKNLKPVIGEENFSMMMEMIKHRKINIPIIAIGGIKLFDVERLLKMGLHGVAVSSGINLSPIREIIIKQFIEKIENTESGQVTNCR